jgi:serine/threonine-protein kinase
MASDGATATATKSGAPDPLIGRVIADRFRITALLARGGMGKVYKAEQAPLGRLCAVKILNPNYSGDVDPEFHRRFFREASITSRITHPNSVTIFDYGKTDDDIYYMVMEYLDGQTLHQALREARTMPEDRVGRISQQICRALREAHTLDVIHRDLKPANIFLSRHGDDEDYVKVLDFGLVKHLTERPEEQLTQTGLFMGSPKYMAPEQIQGGHVDARTDIYSLGIMMYEMLAGKVPFERATSVNILMAHVGEPPPPMREVNPNLVCSRDFEDLVMRCIAKDPAERFMSMDEVLQGIKRVHNVSMTGQVAAVNTSGAYVPLQTDPPPAVRSGSGPAFALAAANTSAPANASGSLTPMGMLRADNESDLGGLDAEQAPRRSKAWIGVGVLIAAALGGVLGMVAFRMTSGASPAVAAPSSTPSAVAAGVPVGAATIDPPAVPASSASAASSAASKVETRGGKLAITSEPAGASVREDGVELCAATPCDVTFDAAGRDAAEPGRTHKLVLAHAGFRTETRSVKAGEPALHVKLARTGGGGGGARPVAAPAPKPASTEPTPNGFKDLPY